MTYINKYTSAYISFLILYTDKHEKNIMIGIYKIIYDLKTNETETCMIAEQNSQIEIKYTTQLNVRKNRSFIYNITEKVK